MKRMMKVHSAWAVLALLLVTACAAWQPAKSFDEKLAYGYSVHTAVLNTAATGVETNALSLADAKQISNLADESRVLLDAARTASKVGDIKTAEGQLALATNILAQLQTYLNTRTKP